MNLELLSHSSGDPLRLAGGERLLDRGTTDGCQAASMERTGDGEGFVFGSWDDGCGEPWCMMPGFKELAWLGDGYGDE